MKNRDELLEERRQQAQLFNKTTADIPAGYKLISHVTNRPYTTTFVALAIMAGLLWLSIGRSTPIMILSIVCLVLFTVTLFIIPNNPIIDVYESFVVAYDKDDPTHIRIIPADKIVVWDVHNEGAGFVQFLEGDPENPDDTANQVIITVPTVNYNAASGALHKTFAEKFVNQVKLRRYQEQHKGNDVTIKQRLKYLGGYVSKVFNNKTRDNVQEKVLMDEKPAEAVKAAPASVEAQPEETAVPAVAEASAAKPVKAAVKKKAAPAKETKAATAKKSTAASNKKAPAKKTAAVKETKTAATAKKTAVKKKAPAKASQPAKTAASKTAKTKAAAKTKKK